MSLAMGFKSEMKTLSECTTMLEKRGFKTQFLVLEDCIQSLASERKYIPEQVEIINFYRFEGNSNPDDNAILYVIETISGEVGMLIDAYGAQADSMITKFIGHVESIRKKEHATDFGIPIYEENVLNDTKMHTLILPVSDMGIGYKILDYKS